MEKQEILLGSSKEAKGRSKDKVQVLLEGKRIPSRLAYLIEVEISWLEVWFFFLIILFERCLNFGNSHSFVSALSAENTKPKY